jgi:tetratricopeptide (TPR) repeat protein
VVPDSVRALDLLGLVYLTLDRPHDAEAVLQKAVKAAPDDMEAALHLGRTLMALRRTEEARRFLEKSEELRARGEHRIRQGATSWRDFPKVSPEVAAELALERTPRPRFVDVAPRSAFSYVTNNGFTGRKYFVEPLCGGVAILDYDNDGFMDIFLTNGAKLPELEKTGKSFHNALLRNKGDGTFEDVTHGAGLTGETLGYSLGAAAGDYDNDGWTDLYVANAGANTLYRNNGDGTFTDVTAASGLGNKPRGTLSVQAAWFDYDNDGLLDLVLSNYTLWTPETDRRCVREDGVDYYCHPKTYSPVPHRLYRNAGGGKFEDVTERTGFHRSAGKGMGIGIADFNGDGWLDVFIANDTEPNFLYVNRQGVSFEESALLLGVAYNDDAATVSAMGVDVRDYDNDGWPDIFYNNLMGQTWALFRNLSGKAFRYASLPARLVRLSEPYSGWSAAFIDYNNDGWKDIYSANGDVDSLRRHAEQHDTLFENTSGQEFVDVSAHVGEDFLRLGYQRGAAVADLNNDGSLDLVVTTLGRKPRILMNTGADGNWMLFDLRGRRSARDAIGAKIRVTTPSGRTLYNHVATSIGLMSSSDRRVHFGLGEEQSAATVEICWPSGTVQVMRNVKANQVLQIEER